MLRPNRTILFGTCLAAVWLAAVAVVGLHWSWEQHANPEPPVTFIDTQFITLVGLVPWLELQVHLLDGTTTRNWQVHPAGLVAVLLLSLAILPLLWAGCRALVGATVLRDCCDQCGYLGGASERCPECGELTLTWQSQSQSQSQSQPRRGGISGKRWMALAIAAAGFSLVLAGCRAANLVWFIAAYHGGVPNWHLLSDGAAIAFSLLGAGLALVALEIYAKHFVGPQS